MIDFTFTYGDLEIFLLILVRVTMFVYIAPFFSMNNTPHRVKICFSVFLSFLLYGLAPVNTLEYNTVLGYTIIVLKEFFTGLIIGYSAQICTLIASLAGQVADMQVGLSMVQVMSPNSREQVPVSAGLYQYSFLAMMLVSGLYRYFVSALADSFLLIPVNGAIFNSDKLLNSMIKFLSAYMIIGFRICLPIFIVTFMMNVILGVLARVAPQMNMFAVGMQLKLIVGLLIMYITSTLLYNASDFIFSNMRQMITEFINDLM
ncbi:MULTISPECIES: flagellar biosynthetic protein FliR [unclassified Butyrivibrio]|uniref:flagellar biosynthetic protein FliR n=1 Tax=unclassified Butyrivibrio TaxID=2639466 RepID=UPI0003B3DFB8|nr:MULTISPECIES: flagellar biosynthetic protein FliR [unclassified Butyrivibrio]SEK44115.1 flagellar biosynthetic protein FliR [Butyrivibrio sp. ob235]